MSAKNRDDLKIWALAGGCFLALILAYVAFFTIASRNPVQSVPLENRQAP
ncbi:MAG TPA: hypothetical protein VGD88_17840 [Opitutaceae bacterium]